MSKKTANPLGKIHDEEEIFVLRGRDLAAPATICFWIAANITNDACPDSKLREALDCALRMRRQENRRGAD